MKIKKKKQVHDLKKQAKPAEEKSDNKLLVQKKIDNRLLKERASEIQQIGDETNYDDLIYYFKGPSSPVILLDMKIHQIFMIKQKIVIKKIQAAEEEQKNLN